VSCSDLPGQRSSSGSIRWGWSAIRNNPRWIALSIEFRKKFNLPSKTAQNQQLKK
jgi:hypothetical protein